MTTASQTPISRHRDCRCTVTYECGRQRQDVWSKRKWEAPEEAAQKKPTVFTQEEAEALQAEKLRGKGLTKGERDGILKAKDSCVTDAVNSGDISLNLNPEKQNRHIKGSPDFVNGKSYLTISSKEIQEVINEKSGTGELIYSRSGQWTRKEKIFCDKTIGVSVNPMTGEETPTSCGTIHYSKTGTHLVPRRK